MERLVVLFCLVLVGSVSCQLDTPQKIVDYLSSNLQVQYTITTNMEDIGGFARTKGFLTFTNNGNTDVTDTSWEIYFCSIRLFEPETLHADPLLGKELGTSKLAVYHINGCLHKISPMAGFTGLAMGVSVRADYVTSDWQSSRTDVSPNWYVVASTAEARTILSTAGQSLDFVTDFTSPDQWKRRDYDTYNPYSPEDRYELNADVSDLGGNPLIITPTPKEVVYNSGNKVVVSSGDWVVVSGEPATDNAANYLADKLGMKWVDVSKQPLSRYILLSIGQVVDTIGNNIDNDEAYRIDVQTNGETVMVVGTTTTGVIYGAQSTWSLYVNSPELPEVTVVDYPRFGYRGMMADVGRNFVTKESILKLLDVMGMYKLNKFHFHLSDDEGWRIEIPDLPELTEIGGYRCHDLTETKCVISQLGSGPGISTSGSGFYTVAEYREILQYADDRGIEVIPEIDMPGHGHAAIKAMEARYNKMKDTDPVGAAEYLLSDPDDTSQYVSIQYFRDNAINPCIASSGNFVRKIVQEIKLMHADIQPLKIFHFGGDEVPHGAWEDSPACASSGKTPAQLMEDFIYSVATWVNDEGLDLGGWEDGLMKDLYNTYDRSKMPNANVFGYAWNNIWEWGGGSRAYALANADFKAVLSHATDLYFDMPYEPDPEERGFYWATRFTETRNTFNYMPDDVYENIEVDLFGNPMTKEQVCQTVGCIPLNEAKRSNVVGMAGQLWSETQRTPEQFDYMVYPRLLPVAERAWHKADWESLISDPVERKRQRDADWELYANTLGYKELARLDELGVTYNVPTPGAKWKAGGEIAARCNFPGLQIEFSCDNGMSWTDYKEGQRVPVGSDVLLRTRSADGSRTSRTVTLAGPSSNNHLRPGHVPWNN
ncbi:beta-hexosaminidase-like [Amphiura filiformis]|uniref:beta-hexosaminidase-like n=1 Tax=Amphiura filiformis TaxID=82378 RepID=UPI003B21BA99